MLDLLRAGVFGMSFATFWDTVDRYLFTPDFDTYEHLTFFNSPDSFKLLVLGLYVGVVLAGLCMYYNKHVLGAMVRKLDGAQALSAENAVGLSELGLQKNIFIRLSLMRGYSLRNVIGIVKGDSEGEKKREGRPDKVSPLTDRFYLLPEKRDASLSRFRTGGTTWLGIVLLIVVGLVTVILLFKLAPLVVGMLDNAIDGLFAQPDVLN